ncbi:hypothetical protein A1O7_06020 [Cladophialophora yegresii CBS 114405]|uniref:Clr5 domain-containing protein n=1 Tax=Cladophialophora yegresii CBS 114405 TaxID=1182544 RepID=W9VSQ6_9EURO|nr:uncharacterized protein A1O7_06020 [Cladophialophora yegresii CBS 114405]EXJ58593.1 hypothetical protein A1O7_06020 [Cladophialophora yegresii CBS 114405]
MDELASPAAPATTSVSPNIEHLLSRWPVASTLSHHLPVGDLITVSRLSVTLRALLHGFKSPPKDVPDILEPSNSVRPELYIGHHGTVYWQRLKDRAPFECSSQTHTKGPAPKPCLYCSRPICDACIVRDSMFKGHENTFPKRVRCLCKQCWESGNNSQTSRYPLALAPPPGKEDSSGPPSSSSPSPLTHKQWYDPSGSTRDYCTCTLIRDGILCLECKAAQNSSAVSTSTSASEPRCHGQSCTNTLTPEDEDRRRICLWCNKALPRPLGGTTRHHWTQKIIEARARHAASRSADVEEWNRKRLKERTMSRREMRGDDAVRDDPDADLPQLVRHLDTINYQNYMAQSSAPSPDIVFASKTGYWRYSRGFMLAMRPRCALVLPLPRCVWLKAETAGAGTDMVFAQTNGEKAQDRLALREAMMHKMPRARLSQWCAYRTVIMECLLERKLTYEATREFMQREHDFEASTEEYRKVLGVWTSQERLRQSLEYDLGTPMKGKEKHVALPKRDHLSLGGKAAAFSGNPYIKGRHIDSDNDHSSQMSSPEYLRRRTASGGSDATFSGKDNLYIKGHHINIHNDPSAQPSRPRSVSLRRITGEEDPSTKANSPGFGSLRRRTREDDPSTQTSRPGFFRRSAGEGGSDATISGNDNPHIEGQDIDSDNDPSTQTGNPRSLRRRTTGEDGPFTQTNSPRSGSLRRKTTREEDPSTQTISPGSAAVSLRRRTGSSDSGAHTSKSSCRDRLDDLDLRIQYALRHRPTRDPPYLAQPFTLASSSSSSHSTTMLQAVLIPSTRSLNAVQPDANEEPPPYDADGWTWPEEVENGHEHEHEHEHRQAER